jgi:hypothetical protein
MQRTHTEQEVQDICNQVLGPRCVCVCAAVEPVRATGLLELRTAATYSINVRTTGCHDKTRQKKKQCHLNSVSLFR